MPATYGFLSTYPPTQCGLATFNAALATHLNATGGSRRRPAARRATASSGGIELDRAAPRVVHTWHTDTPGGWAAAANALNRFDVAIIQHEYGIYPGDAGDEVLPLLRALKVPAIVVLHTVLSHPDPLQRSVLERIAATADALVTMTDTARQRLTAGYAVDPRKISVIPHGAGSHDQRAARQDHDRPHLLTWGLLGPGKGIEWALRALALLQRPEPSRSTRSPGGPTRRCWSSSATRTGTRCKALAAELGVADAVRWEDVYLDDGRAVPADPLGRRGGAAVRLDRAGHLGRADRGGRRRGAGGGDRVPARRRAAGRRARAARAAPGPGGDGGGDPAPAGRARAAPAGSPGWPAARRCAGPPSPPATRRWPPGCSPTARRSRRRSGMTRTAPAASVGVRDRMSVGLRLVPPPIQLADAPAPELGPRRPALRRHRPARARPQRDRPARARLLRRRRVPRACWWPAGSRGRPPGWSRSPSATWRSSPTPRARTALPQPAELRPALARRAVDRRLVGPGAVGPGHGRRRARTVPWIRREALAGLRPRRTAAVAVAARDGLRRARRGRGAARRPARRATRPTCSPTRPPRSALPGPDPDWVWPEPELTYANPALAEVVIAAGDLLGDEPLLRRRPADARLALPDAGARRAPVDRAGRRLAAGRAAGTASTSSRSRRPRPPTPAPRRPRSPATTAGTRRCSRRSPGSSGDNDTQTVMYDPLTGGCYDGLTADGPNLNQGAESTLALVSTLQHARRLATRSATRPSGGLA